MNRLPAAGALGAALVIACVGCSSMSPGDAAACETFKTSAAAYSEAQAAVLVSAPSDEAKDAYRDAVSGHADALREAASQAESVELSGDLTEAASLWGSDDTAYYLHEADIADACS